MRKEAIFLLYCIFTLSKNSNGMIWALPTLVFVSLYYPVIEDLVVDRVYLQEEVINFSVNFFFFMASYS